MTACSVQYVPKTPFLNKNIFSFTTVTILLTNSETYVFADVLFFFPWKECLIDRNTEQKGGSVWKPEGVNYQEEKLSQPPSGDYHADSPETLPAQVDEVHLLREPRVPSEQRGETHTRAVRRPFHLSLIHFPNPTASCLKLQKHSPSQDLTVQGASRRSNVCCQYKCLPPSPAQEVRAL